ncbi:MAG: signal recognition particle-docking protein FtsY [Actinobacteria bacterium]|nr:signal recognition particle-docking protein FtsY [Actinomycetota bacterium]
MSAEVFVPVLIGIVILVGLAFFFVNRVSGRRKPPAPRAPEELIPGVGDDATETITTQRPTIEDVSLDTAVAPVEEAPVLEELEIERPAPAQGRMARLRARLARSNTAIGRGLLSLLSSDKIDDEVWEEVEDTLLLADLGVPGTEDLVARLRTQVRVDGIADPDELRRVLEAELLVSVGPDLDRTLDTDRRGERPAVIMVVGVNGTGKTTTVGKLGRLLVAEDKDVMLGAADTFRAAATEQLQTWGERVGVPVVAKQEGADPAAVAFDTVSEAIDAEADVAIVDTAGRLHTKTGLMDELGKVKRVIEKQAEVSEVLLVLDATTGQNGLNQARVFAEVVDVTGIVLTKLDGTAKGGIVVAVQQELGVPVKLVGLGEGPDDLAFFDPQTFVEALVEA